MNRIDLTELQLPLRRAPRDPALRQSNYLEQFDCTTFAYDVFIDRGRTFFICPPTPETDWQNALKQIKLDGTPISETKYNFYSNKIQKLIIDSEFNNLEIGAKSIQLERPVALNGPRKKILYTLQKDNLLHWINDWIEWYKIHHGIDTVIIYDNESALYDPVFLRDQIISSDIEVIVESVPFKYGPGSYMGSAWDSDYLQYAMFEHVRYKYCHGNSQIINADIDELLVCDGNKSIFDFTSLENGVYLYPGRWIELEQEKEFSFENFPRHIDHTLLDISQKCPSKWTANLNNLPDSIFLRVHDISGSRSKEFHRPLASAAYLHHRCISNNWKYKRAEAIVFDKSKHVQNPRLDDVIAIR